MAGRIVSFLIILFISYSPMQFAQKAKNCTNYNKDEFIKIFLANPGVETYRKNPCFRDNKVSFSVNNDLEGELRLGKINRFESVKFSPDKWNYANYFRRFELTLFKEAGMPEYSIKEGSETDLSLEIYRIARGLIKYKTVWKIDKRYLVLLMDGKDYEITISLYWSENLE